MSKKQFWTLNLVGGGCALLILCDVILGLLNSTLNESVASMQAQFNQAQQLQTTAQSLVLRVARESQNDLALRDLLARHDFKVNPGAHEQPKPAP